jgi:hypothetical protein
LASRVTDIGNPKLRWGKGRADACLRTEWRSAIPASDHRGTPPEDVIEVAAGLLARGS